MSRSNIMLMGCPGAGKSTAGALVAEILGMTYIDFDLDILENVWGMKVADKLMSLGSDRFIEAEGQEFLKFSAKDSVIGLSGSNPMYPQFRPHAQSLGTSFYLDVPYKDIIRYLNKKTTDAANAIVGKREGMTWEDIVDYRQQFYIKNYDVRIICEHEEAPRSVASKIVTKWRNLERNKYYKSTRASSHEQIEKSFFDVVIQGLAPDGGLYVPQGDTPRFTSGQWQRLVPMSYIDRTAMILEAWVDPTQLHPSRLYHMIREAYKSFEDPDIAPLRKIDDDIYIQELFHGPTASFKDLALQVMPLIFEEAVTQQIQRSSEEAKYLVLVATSGDTGSAVLHGFKDCNNLAVMVLYPERGISNIQRRQMTSITSRNVKVLGVDADFDFCQAAVKSIFTDQDLACKIWDNYRYKFTAANSINWGRLLPQVVYHASGYLDMVKQGVISFGEPIDICVPTGNFGNILAAFYAKEMGIPFQTLICASNTNNILHDFFTMGNYDLRGRHLKKSISPSIDILKSSNLERFLYHMTKDGNYISSLFHHLSTEQHFKISEGLQEQIGKLIEPGWANEDECKATIKTCYNDNGYLLDPHTAVALSVVLKRKSSGRKVMISGTAHFGKFGKDVLLALGRMPNGGSPSEVLKQLEELGAKPRMNESLRNAMMKDEMHVDVCKDELIMVKKKMEEFLKEMTKIN